MIHSTAIVHPGARVGTGVSVGPHAIVEAGAQIGDGCVIQAHAVIGGAVSLGRDNRIGYGAVIGGDPQDQAFDCQTSSAVRIGHGNDIREYCTIHRGSTEGSATVLGDRCVLLAGAHLGHNVRLGDRVVLGSKSLLGGFVNVGDDAQIGDSASCHQHVRVGCLAYCQRGSAFSKDVPPFTVGTELNALSGVNSAGLHRAGFSRDQCAELDEAFSLLFLSGRNVTQALTAARERSWGREAQAFFEFVAGAKVRGICDFVALRKGPPSWRSYREDPAVL